MGIIEVILISIGLAMDAFAVSVCKGLAMKKIDFKKMLIIGLYFGIFQGGMPVIGYLLGTLCCRIIRMYNCFCFTSCTTGLYHY